MVLKNGLSRMKGDSHVRFLGEDEAATFRPYLTRFTVWMSTVRLFYANNFAGTR